MNYFKQVETSGHEQVTFFYDEATGLKAIVAIHSTNLGPALGGTRMWQYASEEEALNDALRLAKGMTYKAAAAGLNLGGGKAVIIGNPKTDKSEALFRTYGKCVNSLGGRYITAEDVGTDVDDMEYVFMETPYVTGIDTSHGGSGNPAPFTAYGVYQGTRAALEARMNTSSYAKVRVAIQGLGQVGWELAKLLIADKAIIIATDIDPDRCERAKRGLGVHEIVKPDEIYGVDCDIFAPCALGAVINEQTVEKLKCKIVAGSANNQLKEERFGDVLAKRNILYAPDYVVNAGGLINVYQELEGYSRDRSERFCKGIYTNCKRVFDIAIKEHMTPMKAADRMVELRIKQQSSLKPNFNTFLREKFDKR
jgi:leucine dehydrogenase